MALEIEPSSGGRRPRPPRFQHRARSHADAHADSTPPEPARDFTHPLFCSADPSLITRQEDLLSLIAHLRATGSFAFDSEFIGELTYIPKLCLIQVASPARVALIDTLAGLDLVPFWELIADPSVEKVVHAGQQDVEPVFAGCGKPPANLFDTQIAVGFIGLGHPLSLSRLVHAVVGAKLAKGLTFTHWDKRPLSPHQIRYAADDVRFLPAVRFEIGKRLDALGHTQWASEESATLADPELYTFDAESQFTRIRGSGNLHPRNQAVLRELTIWRNQAARADDLPPRSLVKDEVLLDIARQPVGTIEELARVHGLPRSVEANHGSDIVQTVRRAMALPESQWPAVRSYEPTPAEKFRADALFASAQCICTGRQIDPALVASRQEIGELYRLTSNGESPDGLRILRGWRRKAVGQHLLNLLQGRLEISSVWADGSLQTHLRGL